MVGTVARHLVEPGNVIRIAGRIDFVFMELALTVEAEKPYGGVWADGQETEFSGGIQAAVADMGCLELKVESVKDEATVVFRSAGTVGYTIESVKRFLILKEIFLQV